MGRGPTALFGAIVAVGLGPALWLGVQFGGQLTVPRPPAVVGEHGSSSDQQLLGGTGAGDATTDDSSRVIRSNPQANVEPLATRRAVRPARHFHRDLDQVPRAHSTPSAAPTATTYPSGVASNSPIPPSTSPTQAPDGSQVVPPVPPPGAAGRTTAPATHPVNPGRS